MIVEILTFSGCPNAASAMERVREALKAEALEADIRAVEVDTPELAQQMRFLGSPSVRVDGRDVEPGADRRLEFGLMCRTYREGDQAKGAPGVALIRHALSGQF